MRERVLESVKTYLIGQKAFHQMNIENLLEQPEDSGLNLMSDIVQELGMLTKCQSRLENLALFTEF